MCPVFSMTNPIGKLNSLATHITPISRLFRFHSPNFNIFEAILIYLKAMIRILFDPSSPPLIKLITFLTLALGLLIAVTIHEFSHAWTANHLGDPNPRSQGRLTLNPLAHLDPIGTVMLLLFGFGWGKPVQFDPFNFQNPRRDTALVSLAGPSSNLILATLLSFIGKLLLSPLLFSLILSPIIYLNILLAVFNFIPIYPLDGEKIIMGLLPKSTAYEFQAIMKRYGTLLLILLILPFSGQSAIISLISPVVNFIVNLLI